MYILWNATKNLVRNKGRNLLMAIIILVIIVATAISIIINTTTASIIKDYKGRFGAEVSLQYDHENFTDGQRNGTEPIKGYSARDLVNFSKSKYLRSVDYESTSWGTLDNLQADGEMMVVGSSREDIDPSFRKGDYKIVEGSVYKEIGECLVEKKFADLNNLKIGDTFKMYLRSMNMDIKKDPKEITLKISGIYEDVKSLGAGSSWGSSFYVHTDTTLGLEFIDLDEKDSASLFATFYLKSPEMLEDFTKDLRSKGLSDDIKVMVDETGYNKVVGPVEGLTGVTTTFMIAVIVLGSVILLIISIMSIRERKYEIGVLRAMGMKKSKVALGIVCETLIITILCLGIGLGIGVTSAQPVADTLLADQVNATKNKNQDYQMVTTSKQDYPPVEDIEVSLSNDAIVQIILVSIVIAGASSIIGIFHIMRYEPMKILSERS